MKNIIIAISLYSATPALSDEIHLMGLANLNCDDFNKAVSQFHEEPEKALYYVEYRHYVSGYFTGFNTAQKIFGGHGMTGHQTPVEKMMRWLEAFCGDNETKSINEAMQTLVQTVARIEATKK
jgi:hypothetical protein